jgi:hypothetical protein
MPDRIVAFWDGSPRGAGNSVAICDDLGFARVPLSTTHKMLEENSRFILNAGSIEHFVPKTRSDAARLWRHPIHECAEEKWGLPDWVENGGSREDMYFSIFGRHYSGGRSNKKPETVQETDEHKRMATFFMGKKNTTGCNCGAWATDGRCSDWCDGKK